MASSTEEIFSSSHVTHRLGEYCNDQKMNDYSDQIPVNQDIVTGLFSDLSLREENHKALNSHHPPSSPLSLIDKYYGPLEPQKPIHTDNFDYVVEVYGFSPNLKTRDILQDLYKNGSSKTMKLKWVDDTHALIIYTSAMEARAVAETTSFIKIKTRLLSHSTHKESLDVAKNVAESIKRFLCDLNNSKPPSTVHNDKKSPFTQSADHSQLTPNISTSSFSLTEERTPLNSVYNTSLHVQTSTEKGYLEDIHSKSTLTIEIETNTSEDSSVPTSNDVHKDVQSFIKTNERPQSSATVARRMISHALGVQIKPTPEQREKETRLLREARERKQQKKATRSIS